MQHDKHENMIKRSSDGLLQLEPPLHTDTKLQLKPQKVKLRVSINSRNKNKKCEVAITEKWCEVQTIFDRGRWGVGKRIIMTTGLKGNRELVLQPKSYFYNRYS